MHGRSPSTARRDADRWHRFATSLRTWLGLRWWMLLLALCLPVHTVSGAIADLLGARHMHRVPSVAVATPDSLDAMAGWQDFRRARYDETRHTRAMSHARMHEYMHEHMHAVGQRHHHDASDSSVEPMESLTDQDGAAAESLIATAACLYIATDEAIFATRSSELLGQAWQTHAGERFESADTRRIERPPQRRA